MHWTAFIPWGLVRFIPTFVAVQAGRGAVQNIQDAIPDGFTQGMTLVGGMLPAVGFAMLLRIMPVSRYWYMLTIGFVLFAYLQVPLQGIAIFGVGDRRHLHGVALRTPSRSARFSGGRSCLTPTPHRSTRCRPSRRSR